MSDDESSPTRPNATRKHLEEHSDLGFYVVAGVGFEPTQAEPTVFTGISYMLSDLRLRPRSGGFLPAILRHGLTPSVNGSLVSG